jgi:hypothetical protein
MTNGSGPVTFAEWWEDVGHSDVFERRAFALMGWEACERYRKSMPSREQLALQVWSIDAPEAEMAWDECRDQERYLCIADAVLVASFNLNKS